MIFHQHCSLLIISLILRKVHCSFSEYWASINEQKTAPVSYYNKKLDTMKTVRKYEEAVDGLLNALHDRQLRQSKDMAARTRLALCFRRAIPPLARPGTVIPEKAKCLLAAFSHRYRSKRSPYRLVEQSSKNRNENGRQMGRRTSPQSLLQRIANFLLHNFGRGYGGKKSGRRSKSAIDRLRTLQKRLKNARSYMRAQSRRGRRFLSPRLAPLFSEQSEQMFLSPSFLSFYSQLKAKDNNFLPMPKLLQMIGFNADDTDAILNIILEFSGASGTIDRIYTVLNDEYKKRQLVTKIADATRRLDKGWKDFKQSLSSQQTVDIDRDGFAFLNEQQLHRLYGNKGMYPPTIASPQLSVKIRNYNLTLKSEQERFLFNAIRQLASLPQRKAVLGSWNRLLQQEAIEDNATFGMTLQPFAFGPSVLTPSVLGPLTLSPTAFSPAILSPSALSPLTLSPYIFSPAILSPYVLGPQTLSPSALSPTLLSPYILSPNVLSPSLLNPTLLSPNVLSPNILSPSILGPTILSPAALSPSVLSPCIFQLCPTILSPSVLS